MKHLLCLLTVTAGLALPTAQAVSIIETHSFLGLGLGITDGNPTGMANTQNIASAITSIEDITVTLDITGGFNGDLYVYLQHETGLAVLMNRIGKTNANSFGSDDPGVNLSFNDLIVNPDVHNASSGGGPLTGDFNTDARFVDPADVLDTDARTADLTVFSTMAASGDWTLFVADLSTGGTHTVESWEIEITGIPEPSTALLMLLGVGVLARRRR